MSSDDEAELWAKRYLDLWQDQMTALANNPDFAKFFLAPVATKVGDEGASASQSGSPAFDPDQMAKWARAWLDGFTAASPFSPNAASAINGPGTHDPGSEQSSKPQGPGSLGSSSELQRSELDALERRLGELERRIEALESGASAKPRAKGGKRGTSSPGKRSTS